MHRSTPIAAALATLALSSAFFTVSAQTDVAEQLSTVQRFGNVTVLNGGADLDEAERLRRMAPQYPLRVVFSVRGGDYAVADSFAILRDGQLVAEVPTAGPWLLIDLPPGRYTLQARFDGRLSERVFTAGRNGATLHWVAPASVG